jgi:hypothetical protein
MRVQAKGGVEMSIEYVIVKFEPQGQLRDRSIRVDGQRRGITNTMFMVGTGRHRFDLGAPRNYNPNEIVVDVVDTSIIRPLLLEFT